MHVVLNEPLADHPWQTKFRGEYGIFGDSSKNFMVPVAVLCVSW